MARGVRFKPNRAGMREILNSGATQAQCLGKARAACERANAMTHGEFVADVRAGSNRCHAMVKPADGSKGDLAARDNLRKNILVKARGW